MSIIGLPNDLQYAPIADLKAAEKYLMYKPSLDYEEQMLLCDIRGWLFWRGAEK